MGENPGERGIPLRGVAIVMKRVTKARENVKMKEIHRGLHGNFPEFLVF